MLAGIDENRLKTGKHKVKVRYFPGARTDDMYDCMKPLLQKFPDYIILHIGTNDVLDNTSREILDKIVKLKTYIQNELRKCKITISTPIKRHDHGKDIYIFSIRHYIRHLVYQLLTTPILELFIYLNSGCLHVNDKGLGKLTINLNLKIRKL